MFADQTGNACLQGELKCVPNSNGCHFTKYISSQFPYMQFFIFRFIFKKYFLPMILIICKSNRWQAIISETMIAKLFYVYMYHLGSMGWSVRSSPPPLLHIRFPVKMYGGVPNYRQLKCCRILCLDLRQRKHQTHATDPFWRYTPVTSGVLHKWSVTCTAFP